MFIAFLFLISCHAVFCGHYFTNEQITMVLKSNDDISSYRINLNRFLISPKLRTEFYEPNGIFLGSISSTLTAPDAEVFNFFHRRMAFLRRKFSCDLIDWFVFTISGYFLCLAFPRRLCCGLSGAVLFTWLSALKTVENLLSRLTQRAFISEVLEGQIVKLTK